MTPPKDDFDTIRAALARADQASQPKKPASKVLGAMSSAFDALLDADEEATLAEAARLEQLEEERRAKAAALPVKQKPEMSDAEKKKKIAEVAALWAGSDAPESLPASSASPKTGRKGIRTPKSGGRRTSGSAKAAAEEPLPPRRHSHNVPPIKMFDELFPK